LGPEQFKAVELQEVLYRGGMCEREAGTETVKRDSGLEGVCENLLAEEQ